MNRVQHRDGNDRTESTESVYEVVKELGWRRGKCAVTGNETIS
jgi:hypothetical protein